MKTAKKHIVGVELHCPDCGEAIPAPGGQLFWDVNEIGAQSAVLVCPVCRTKLKFPKGL